MYFSPSAIANVILSHQGYYVEHPDELVALARGGEEGFDGEGSNAEKKPSKNLAA